MAVLSRPAYEAFLHQALAGLLLPISDQPGGTKRGTFLRPKLSEIVNRVEKSDFLSASLYEAKADYRRHGDEIAVIVKEE